jgi:CheY-like chemotaxis protein
VAYESGDLSVPADYRRILKFVQADTHENAVRGCLRQFPDTLLAEWLGELVELGFLEAVPEGDPLDLDFTDYFSARPVRAAAVLAEDSPRLDRDAAAASAALAKSGAYFAEERLANRAPLEKLPADTVVLIVEDDPDQLALADLRVTMAGYRVRVARNARELVEALRQDARLDILLLDVMLPDGDGFEILVKMRHHPKLALLPIVMLTAKDHPEEIRSGLALGADAYVTKPYSKNILADSIRRVLKHAAPK